MKKVIVTFLTFSGVMFLSCKNESAGKNTEINPVAEKTEGETFTADTQSSVIHWIGSKPAGKHTGTINLKEGNLTVKDSQIVAGKFVIDMNTITVTDLKPGDGKEDLETHLKGLGDKKSQDHFFNVKKYPTGSFTIAKVADENGKNIVYGNLSLKGVTKAVNFPAAISITDSLVSIESEPLMINRTYWKINYASKSIFGDLKDKFVHDEVEVKISVKARK